jgi:RNA methyltransferase, TrmH family
MEPVRTHRARTVVEAARLHRARDRRERGLTLVEGPDVLSDVVTAGAKVIEVFGVDPPHDAGVTAVDQRALERLAGTKSPRGPVAVVEIPTEWLDRGRNLLVSVGVSDPGNVGTMIRTAAAFDWGFAYTEGSADPWSPKTIRAGAGGQFQTAVARIGSVGELGEWTTVATAVRGGGSPEAVRDRPVALLVGEEAHGLSDSTIENADHIITIATPGATESLNAAVAAAITMFALEEGSRDHRSDV